LDEVLNNSNVEQFCHQCLLKHASLFLNFFVVGVRRAGPDGGEGVRVTGWYGSVDRFGSIQELGRTGLEGAKMS
jgi:hypothetical protein